ncbi:MAG: hypothetical protein AAF074_08985 [Pseudomonadota bacterium]
MTGETALARSLAPLAVIAALVVVGAVFEPRIWVLEFIVLASTVATLWGLLPHLGMARRAGRLVACAVGTLAVLAQIALPDVRLSPYLAVGTINLLVAYVFSVGLLPGREPVILQVVRLMASGAEEGAGFARFVRRQCVLWAVFGLAGGVAGFAGLFLADQRPAIDAFVGALLATQLAWFVVSHRYANIRYGRPETWLMTLSAMSRPGIWSELRI